MSEVKITPRSERYEVETWDEEQEGWVLENFCRLSRKDAELDVEILKTLGHKSRIVGDSHPTPRKSPTTTGNTSGASTGES